MAKLSLIDFESQEYKDWLASTPAVIQEMVQKYPPDRLYRLNDPKKKRVFITGYDENGTVEVCVSGKYNQLMFERRSFGVNPEDLEECDLPGEDEPTGVILTDRKDIDEYRAASLKNEDEAWVEAHFEKLKLAYLRECISKSASAD